MANEKSQDLKAYEDMKKRRKDPKTEKAIIKEGLKSRYGKNETPMKRERTAEGFKARGNAKMKEVIKNAVSTLGRISNPALAGVQAIKNFRKKKPDFQKGDYSGIKIKGGTAKLRGGGRAGYSVGGKAIRGVSKILMKK